MGQVTLQLDAPPGGKPVLVTLDVVKADIPALLGMDILDRESLTPDTVDDHLSKRVTVSGSNGEQMYIDEWYIPMSGSASSHIYVPIRSTPRHLCRTISTRQTTPKVLPRLRRNIV